MCALPSTAFLLCSTLTVLELLDHIVLHVAIRWYHFGLVLQGGLSRGLADLNVVLTSGVSLTLTDDPTLDDLIVSWELSHK